MEPVPCDLEGSRILSLQRVGCKQEVQHMHAIVQHTIHLSLLGSLQEKLPPRTTKHSNRKRIIIIHREREREREPRTHIWDKYNILELNLVMIKQNNGNPIPILVMTSTIESEKTISVEWPEEIQDKILVIKVNGILIDQDSYLHQSESQRKYRSRIKIHSSVHGF